MNRMTRFGRKIALPSTRQIIHELRVIAAEEVARKLAEPVAAPSAPIDGVGAAPGEGPHG